MINYKDKENFLTSATTGETVYSNHKLEFLRFFESHQRLCDEISGLKYHTITNINDQKRILITKTNFDYAIRKLNSFIIDYIHYISEQHKIDQITNAFERLENQYITDVEYHNFVRRKDNLSVTQEILFNKIYLKYLIRVFDISFLMSKYLQNSLNIASKEIIKDVKFVNYDGFFNNLSIYRDEVSNDLSNLKFDTFLDHYKKLLGYFYTYRHLIPVDDQKDISELLMLVFEYITCDNVIKMMIKVRERAELTNTTRQEQRIKFQNIRKAFNKAYSLCNSSLSRRNILPKTNHEVLFDNTLI